MEEKPNDRNSTLTEVKPKLKAKTELKAEDYLCLACHHKITSDKETFNYNNQSELSFINPAGYNFNIITFFDAEGCKEVGEPTLEFTWFKDHYWSFAICSRCGNHLGWKYMGKDSFYGLIRTLLVKGATLFN